MRCNDCSKFVSFDTDNDPEVDVEVDEDGTVSGTVRIANDCAECGTELTEMTFDVEADFTDEVKKHREEAKEADEIAVAEAKDKGVDAAATDEHTLDVDGGDCSREDNRDTQTMKVMKRGPKKGQTVTKAIPYRYQTQYYGFALTVEVKCSCGETWTQEIKDQTSASGMDSLQ